MKSHPIAILIVVNYVLLVVLQYILYCLMVVKLKKKTPSVQFVRFAWTTPVAENFSMFEQEFHEDRNSMALFKWAKATRVMVFVFMPVFIGAILAFDE